uniref:Uncharacterized protein n=3 Tax=Oryza TaxID=4527 RepID=Q6YUQ4_ORYSJ|nr:hypothetical protein [Oryza sativa Japonica Group]
MRGGGGRIVAAAGRGVAASGPGGRWAMALAPAAAPQSERRRRRGAGRSEGVAETRQKRRRDAIWGRIGAERRARLRGAPLRLSSATD